MSPSFLSAQPPPPHSLFLVLPESSSPSIQRSRFPTAAARSTGPVPGAPTLSGRCSGSGFPALGSFISPGSPTVSPWGSAPLALGSPASRCLPGARRLPRRGSPVSFPPQPRFLGVSPSSLQPRFPAITRCPDPPLPASPLRPRRPAPLSRYFPGLPAAVPGPCRCPAAAPARRVIVLAAPGPGGPIRRGEPGTGRAAANKGARGGERGRGARGARPGARGTGGETRAGNKTCISLNKAEENA